MKYNIEQLKNNITLHHVNDDKYKTDVISIFLTTEFNKDVASKNTLVPAILKRGSCTFDNMQKLEVELEEMYGSNIFIGIDKNGNNHILKIQMETIKDNIVNENMLERSLNIVSELMLKPYLINDTFSEEYVNQEKEILKISIENLVNDKTEYATERFNNEMFKGYTYGVPSFGFINDIDKLTSKEIYDQYIHILKTAQIDIYVYTGQSLDVVKEYLENAFNVDVLNERKDIYIPQLCKKESEEKVKVVKEKMDINQGQLFVGYNVEKGDSSIQAISVFNAILGVGSNSRMFRIFREKEQLAYSARSTFIKNANVIIISAGIDSNNYEKAIKVIEEQICDLRNGNIGESELEDAKQLLISSYKNLQDEQYRIIQYYADQQITGTKLSIEEGMKKIQEVSFEDVKKVANSIYEDTIYFLNNVEGEIYENNI